MVPVLGFSKLMLNHGMLSPFFPSLSEDHSPPNLSRSSVHITSIPLWRFTISGGEAAE